LIRVSTHHRFFPIIVISAFCLLQPGCKKGDTDSVINNTPEQTAEGGIVYTSDANGKLEVWMRQGDQLFQITNSSEFDNWWPRVASDGKRVLYYQSSNSRDVNDFANASLRMADREANTDEEIIGPGDNALHMHGLVDWSGDEKLLVFAGMEQPFGKWQLYTCSVSGDNVRRITLRAEANYLDPVFSADDKFIYCSALPEGDTSSGNYQLFEIEIATGVERQLTSNARRNHHPHASASGEKLVFESLADPDYLGMGKWVLMELELATGKEHLLLEDNNTYMYPRYTNDPAFLYAIQLSVESFSLKLCLVNTEDGTVTPIEDGGNVYSVDTF
jgi:Tol biopolymer transport system component